MSAHKIPSSIEISTSTAYCDIDPTYELEMVRAIRRNVLSSKENPGKSTVLAGLDEEINYWKKRSDRTLAKEKP